MAEQVLAGDHPLTQTERVIDIFTAPSKTFHDILRSAAWWVPFVFIILGSYTLTAAIQTRVGWSQLVENEIRANPKLSERLASLPPEQVAKQQKAMRYSFSYGFYAGPVVQLASLALMALVLWSTINFGFGGDAKYSQVLCVATYAALPGVISALLAALLLFSGREPATFTTQSMIGSNPGYYLDTPGAMKTFLSALDVFTLWTAVLLSIGLAIVAHTKRQNGYIAVFGWFVLIVLVRTAFAALSS